jgi:hypothetical protein
MKGRAVDVDSQAALGDSKVGDGDRALPIVRRHGDLPLWMKIVLLEEAQKGEFKG